MSLSLSLFHASHIDTTHNEEASQPVGDCSSQPFTKKSDRSAQWPSSNVIFIRWNKLCTPLRNIIIDFVIPCDIFWMRWVCFELERVVHHKKLRGGGHNPFFLMELSLSHWENPQWGNNTARWQYFTAIDENIKRWRKRQSTYPEWVREEVSSIDEGMMNSSMNPY